MYVYTSFTIITMYIVYFEEAIKISVYIFAIYFYYLLFIFHSVFSKTLSSPTYSPLPHCQIRRVSLQHKDHWVVSAMFVYISNQVYQCYKNWYNIEVHVVKTKREFKNTHTPFPLCVISQSILCLFLSTFLR